MTAGSVAGTAGILVLVAGMAAASCGERPLAHPCQSDLECAVGWSCVSSLCQPTTAGDAATDGPGLRDAAGRDAANDQAHGDGPTLAGAGGGGAGGTAGAAGAGGGGSGRGGAGATGAGGAPSPGVFTEFPLPIQGCNPFRIAVGSDRNLWFTEPGCDRIGRITTAGEITEYSLPTAGAYADFITPGPDGNLWFTESAGEAIGKLTLDGVASEIQFPFTGVNRFGITAGPDGNLWVADLNGTIRRITTAGDETVFPVSGTATPFAIVAGPDGNIWFADETHGSVGRVTLDGMITVFPAVMPTRPDQSLLRSIVNGPDGALWFTSADTKQVGRIDTSGNVTLVSLPGDMGVSGLDDIALGPDGNLWATEYGERKLARVTPAGTVTVYDLPSTTGFPVGIVTGPDQAIWIVETAAGTGAGDKIVRLQL